jgi:hypothetical protein
MVSEGMCHAHVGAVPVLSQSEDEVAKRRIVKDSIGVLA